MAGRASSPVLLLQSVHNWTPYERQHNAFNFFDLMRQPMIVFTAMRDFADGLTRGFSLFLTERHDTTVKGMSPSPKRHPRGKQG